MNKKLVNKKLDLNLRDKVLKSVCSDLKLYSHSLIFFFRYILLSSNCSLNEFTALFAVATQKVHTFQVTLGCDSKNISKTCSDFYLQKTYTFFLSLFLCQYSKYLKTKSFEIHSS